MGSGLNSWHLTDKKVEADLGRTPRFCLKTLKYV